jgi:hypothetical protein
LDNHPIRVKHKEPLTSGFFCGKNVVKCSMLFLPKESWEIRTTKTKGRGIFAKQEIQQGTLIGDYLGTILHPRDAFVDQTNFYLMFYHDTATIAPDLTKHGVHLLNHACFPNCSFYIYKGHTLPFALRTITAGEEVTINYFLAPKTAFCNPCVHSCQCKQKNCTGTMHLEEKMYTKWKLLTEKQSKETKRERIRYGKPLPLLNHYPDIPESYITQITKLFQSYSNKMLTKQRKKGSNVVTTTR